MSNKKVAVVGAGITGLMTAYYLARSGHDVFVYEKESYAAQKCSYANGGQWSVSNSEVWNTWENVFKGLKWMFKKDAPLYIKPSLEWSKIKWLSKFLWHTMKGDYRKNTVKTIKMGLRSRDLYKEIITKEKIKFDHSECGILHIYDAKNTSGGHKSAGIYLENDVEWEYMTTHPDRPYFKKTYSYFTPSDSVGDIRKFCEKLESILRKKYKVGFAYNHDFDTKWQRFYDAVVICAGVGSKKLAKKLSGDNLPIYPVKGYSITIHDCDPACLPKTSIIDDEAKIVTATLGKNFRVAGTAEFSGENYDIVRSRIEPLLQWVRVNYPCIDRNNYSSWACLRPMTPNMMPIVGKSKRNPKIYFNTGHGHLGWTLAPATAIDIAKMITRELK